MTVTSHELFKKKYFLIVRGHSNKLGKFVHYLIRKFHFLNCFIFSGRKLIVNNKGCYLTNMYKHMFSKNTIFFDKLPFFMNLFIK